MSTKKKTGSPDLTAAMAKLSGGKDTAKELRNDLARIIGVIDGAEQEPTEHAVKHALACVVGRHKRLVGMLELSRQWMAELAALGVLLK